MFRLPKHVKRIRRAHIAAAAALTGYAFPSRAAEPACPLGYHNGRISEVMQLVFFGWNEARIDSQAASVLDYLAKTSEGIPQCPIWIGGHADTSGSALYNYDLSRRRAEAVVEWLRQRGVRAAIHIIWWGETRPFAETGDNVREPQNRRVEITMGWDSEPARSDTIVEPRRSPRSRSRLHSN
jgi:outer membrane protein OmpA-like peptidoglycan-associated protein